VTGFPMNAAAGGACAYDGRAERMPSTAATASALLRTFS